MSNSKTPLTISQATQAIKQHLEPAFRDLLLQGEISNFKKQAASGHLYFSLKDPFAQISAVMFRTDAAKLNPLPKGGDQVIVRGELSIYPPQGSYQVIVRELYYVGLGALLLQLEQLKLKLHQRGWFSAEHKKKLPRFPKKIGVITSPTGAAIQDILHILTRRFSGFHLILNPVRVQGEGAAREIAEAIAQMNRYQLADVLIVGRGGGSIEDLWPFNEEIVAEAIFHSKIPIISAVGHESDYCLADFVADIRAPTPSAAAEIVIAEKAHLLSFLQEGKKRISLAMRQLIKHERQRLLRITSHPKLSSATDLLGRYMQQLDEIIQALDHGMKNSIQTRQFYLKSRAHQATALNPKVRLHYYRTRLQQMEKFLQMHFIQKLASTKKSLQRVRSNLLFSSSATMERWRKQFNAAIFNNKLQLIWQQQNARRKEKWHHLLFSLRSLDPKSLLQKGYAILFAEKSHSLIISTQELEMGQKLRAHLQDGTALLTVDQINSNAQTNF